MTRFTMWRKVKRNNLIITSKQHAHPHSIKNAKFILIGTKTVRGIALTRGNNCLYIKGEK